jgi:DNA repair photolyase
MSLVKSKGNMYDWVTHMHTHLAGECPHKCDYCYVQTGMARMSGKYKGELRLVGKEFSVQYGKGRIIFIEHMNDLFAQSVPTEWIKNILFHCCDWQDNQYIFQTKNPFNALNFISEFPNNFMIGTTIETNRNIGISKAPVTAERFLGISRWQKEGKKVFVTIEPIMDFDVAILFGWLKDIKPEFVNIGADSKGCKIIEPPAYKILKLIELLQKEKIEIRKKVNLKRLNIDMEK